MTQLMSIRDKMILVRNVRLEIDQFFDDVIKYYVRHSNAIKHTRFFREGDDRIHPFPYEFIEHDFPYYGTHSFFHITIRRKGTNDTYVFKVPSTILNSNNDGWCEDWRNEIKRHVSDEDTANGLILYSVKADNEDAI